jgi:hypothetical protein
VTLFLLKLYVLSLEKGSLVISKQPQPAECSFGDSVSFEIEAESFELLSYQWYKDEEKLLGTVPYYLFLTWSTVLRIRIRIRILRIHMFLGPTRAS